MRRVTQPILEYDLEPLVLFLGIIAIAWGVWFLLPFDTMPLGAQYGFMRGMAAEAIWGAAMTTIGVMEIVASVTHSNVTRRVLLIACGCWWLFVAVSIFLGAWRSAGVPILSLYAVANFHTAVRD